MWQKGVKYGAVIRITLLQQFAYIYDFLIRTIFLTLILFIFTKLWMTTFEVSIRSIIEGYTLSKMMWYMLVTESIMMGLPFMIDRIEKEIKNGEIAYFLSRPISYIGFQFGQYVGEAILRIGINLGVGSILIYFMVDGISVTFSDLIGFFILVLMAIIIHYVTVMSLCLSAFWVEDIRGFYLLYSRMMMILGGVLVPLEIFPEWLESITHYLPFQSMFYLPATYLVSGENQSLFYLIMKQGIWLSIFALVLMGIYTMGVKRVNVNGG